MRLARPWGVLRDQHLRDAGLSTSGISRRVRSRRLYRVHQTVYAVVPPEHLSPQGHWLAAVYTCGDGAGLGLLFAAAMWDAWSRPSGPIDVFVPARSGRRSRRGIRVHRSRSLRPADIVIHNGIPVTTPARTLTDLRRALPRDRFLSALRRFEKRRLDTGPLPEHIDDPDRNELERRMLALCRRHGIPLPLTQRVIGPYTVDFLWPEHGLIVETDGWADHRTRSAFESDRERDAWLVGRGYRVIRFTWRQLSTQGPQVAQALRDALVVASVTRRPQP
jgi:very-short-patch-repair endonuclease